ncbi:uncharacterized protein VP01_2397g4 [Puccinia sorghi]|uniref:Uncharacterized protein n=1 Tax=Puccinia sorghi TaxID=27349 RepID=A0A0L6V8N6_9BASI|nr:uncharacterized protein VP01_2397g4 [Puccinia sorghi]
MCICSCHKFGCGKQVYRDNNGIKQMCVTLSNVNFQKHERLAQLNSILRPRPHGNKHQTQNQGLHTIWNTCLWIANQFPMLPARTTTRRTIYFAFKTNSQQYFWKKTF